MASKDYYLVLGISRTESPRGIRKAFRDLALEHHPDRAGPASTPTFREVVEAYEVLSDPERRRRYDASRRPTEAPPTRRSPSPRRPAAPTARELMGEPGSLRPSAEALLDRVLANFMGRPVAKAERPEPLHCDISLDPEEARRGGVLPIRIPIIAPCPDCHGAGHVAGFPCRPCRASGEAPREIVVPLELPAGVRPGTILETSLERWGIRNLWLRARVGVGR